MSLLFCLAVRCAMGAFSTFEHAVADKSFLLSGRAGGAPQVERNMRLRRARLMAALQQDEIAPTVCERGSGHSPRPQRMRPSQHPPEADAAIDYLFFFSLRLFET